MNKQQLQKLKEIIKNVPVSLKDATKYMFDDLKEMLKCPECTDENDYIDESEAFSMYCTIFAYSNFGEAYYKPELFKNPPLINWTMDVFADVRPVNWYILSCIDSFLVDMLPLKYDPKTEADTMIAIKAWFDDIYPGISTRAIKYLAGFKQSLAEYLYYKKLHLVVRYEVMQPYVEFGDFEKSQDEINELLKNVEYPDSGVAYEITIRPFSNEYTKEYVEDKATMACICLYSFSERDMQAAINALEKENDELDDYVC